MINNRRSCRLPPIKGLVPHLQYPQVQRVCSKKHILTGVHGKMKQRVLLIPHSHLLSPTSPTSPTGFTQPNNSPSLVAWVRCTSQRALTLRGSGACILRPPPTPQAILVCGPDWLLAPLAHSGLAHALAASPAHQCAASVNLQPYFHHAPRYICSLTLRCY